MAGASINDIKARIKSVEGTMQITKAMELVATSKLRHAKLKAEGAKPYMKSLCDAIEKIASFDCGTESVYTKSTDGRVLYIVIAGDRGLAGGYNNNVMKLAMADDKAENGIFLPIGKKAREYVSHREKEVFLENAYAVSDFGVGRCMTVAKEITEAFKNGEFTAVKLVYTKFVSMLTQTPAIINVLPLTKPKTKNTSEPIYEGELDEIIGAIIPEYVGGILHAAVCEAAAAECASRRCAMSSANKNAEEMIDTLVLKFNRARQAVITQEITEIVSGAEAL